MTQTAFIFVQIMERPARKCIVKWSVSADNYVAYATEVGSGTSGASAAWDVLTQIHGALYDPVGLWMPQTLRPVGTGPYAHGVEVPVDYDGDIPQGFAVVDLAPCTYMQFQGLAYTDADFATAVGTCMAGIDTCNPEVYGYQYVLDVAPRMQFAPAGWRGYIEMRPVVRLTTQ